VNSLDVVKTEVFVLLLVKVRLLSGLHLVLLPELLFQEISVQQQFLVQLPCQQVCTKASVSLSQ